MRSWITLPAAALGLGALVACAADVGSPPPSPRPNILLFHCHDLGRHLHCYGVRTVRTPNLDAFAAQGVRFARSFCTNPGCSPSRASLFTGRYPHSNGVMGLCHANFAWDLHPGERHMAQILSDGGYATAAVGVIHETRSGPARCGYETYRKGNRARQAVDEAIRLLGPLSSDSTRPFFLCVGTIEPHRLGPPRPEPAGATPGDAGFPGLGIEPDDALGVEVPGHLRDTPSTRLELAGLQGAVRHLDGEFGRLMGALRALGPEVEGRTLVIFTTDHGIAMPRAKCSVYEPGVSVALLLRLPGRAGWHGGGVRPELVSNVDCLPTILELVGLPVPPGVQGHSLVPLLDGRPGRPRAEVFTELTYHSYYDPRRAIRTETHKLIANFSSAPGFMDPSQSWRPASDPVCLPGHTPHIELYDLENDPFELINLAERPAFAPLRADLLRRLHRHMVTTGDSLLAGAVASPQHEATLSILRGSVAP